MSRANRSHVDRTPSLIEEDSENSGRYFGYRASASDIASRRILPGRRRKPYKFRFLGAYDTEPFNVPEQKRITRHSRYFHDVFHFAETMFTERDPERIVHQLRFTFDPMDGMSPPFLRNLYRAAMCRERAKECRKLGKTAQERRQGRVRKYGPAEVEISLKSCFPS